MDTSLVLAIGGPLVTGLAAVLVARYQYQRASKEEIASVVSDVCKPHHDKISKLDARIAAIEGTEHADVAKLREDADALGHDLAAIRKALDEHIDAEDKRRARAREAGAARDLETTRQLSELTGAVQRLQERLKDLLDAAGGFRGIARSRDV